LPEPVPTGSVHLFATPDPIGGEETMSSLPAFPRREIPNPQILAHAEQIAKAVFLLYEHRLECIPSLLLEGAFAIELYLKSLASDTTAMRSIGHPSEGVIGYQLAADPALCIHPLDRLYDVIDERTRDVLQEADAANPAISGVSLRDALARYRNLFVDIRYYFDGREVELPSPSDIINLVRFFRRVLGCKGDVP
jgi:hypothetical protein